MPSGPDLAVYVFFGLLVAVGIVAGVICSVAVWVLL